MEPVRATAQLVVRTMHAGDEGFVFRGWLKSCRRCERHRHLPGAVYYRDVHEQLERLMCAPVVGVSLAVSAADPGLFLGFICTEQLGGRTQILHYAYVKSGERHAGVFRALAAGVGLQLARPFAYTHHTRLASALVQRFPAAMYRPDILALPR